MIRAIDSKKALRVKGTLRVKKMLRVAGLLVASVGCCAVFWLLAPEWNHTVLGRYSVKWFAGSLVANIAIALVTLVWVRRLLSCDSTVKSDPRQLSLLKKLVFAGVVVVPTLAGVEVALRYFYLPEQPHAFRPPGATAKGFHAILQHADRTQQDGVLRRAYRGQVYSLETTADVRVLCLGGSTTWGHHLSRDETWPAMLEQRLRDRGIDVEVINAARPWYTSAHSIANYALQLRYFNADVVIMMHGINDLVRSFPMPGEPPAERDYGSYQGPMRNVLSGYRANNRTWTLAQLHPLKLLSKSAIYQVLFGCDSDKSDIPDVDVELDAFPTLAYFRDHMRYLIHLCQQDGVRVVLTTQAHVYSQGAEGFSGDFDKTMREVYMRTASGGAVSAASLGEAMQAVRVATLDLAQTSDVLVADVERAVEGHEGVFMDDVHLLPKGNALAADALADVLMTVLGKDTVTGRTLAPTTLLSDSKP